MTFEITEFFIALVFLAFAWIAIDFLFEQLGGRFCIWKNRRKTRECHLCGKIYAEKPRVKISRCPDCDGVNPRKAHRRLG